MNLGIKSVHSRNYRAEILQAIEAGETAVHYDDFLFNAVRDLDGDVIRDLDDDPVYENEAIRDNPLTPTRIFQTVAELLAYPGKLIDTAITLNWEAGDGNMQEWKMVADPHLVETDDTLESDDGYGFYRTFTTRGPDSDDNFVTFKDLAASQMVQRYTHYQGSPSAVWVCNHNLGRVVNVVIETIDRGRIAASVTTQDLNTVIITFAFARSGTAYFS